MPLLWDLWGFGPGLPQIRSSQIWVGGQHGSALISTDQRSRDYIQVPGLCQLCVIYVRVPVALGVSTSRLIRKHVSQPSCLKDKRWRFLEEMQNRHTASCLYCPNLAGVRLATTVPLCPAQKLCNSWYVRQRWKQVNDLKQQWKVHGLMVVIRSHCQILSTQEMPWRCWVVMNSTQSISAQLLLILRPTQNFWARGQRATACGFCGCLGSALAYRVESERLS